MTLHLGRQLELRHFLYLDDPMVSELLAQIEEGEFDDYKYQQSSSTTAEVGVGLVYRGSPVLMPIATRPLLRHLLGDFRRPAYRAWLSGGTGRTD